MNMIRQTWKRSLATFALLATVNHQMPTVAAADPGAKDTPVTDSEATTPPSVAPPANRGAATDPSAEEKMRELFMKRYGLRVSSNKVPRPASPASAEAAARGAQIETKLKAIILPEIMFDGLPLGEVVRILSEQCRKRDPDGVNFLLNPNSPAIEAGFDPNTGLPLTAQPSEKIDLSSVAIKFALPLRNISMKDLLDAIVRVADTPIAYGLEDYGVVISLAPRRTLDTVRGLQMSSGGGSSTRLAAHTFKVDTNTFVAGLESAFGIKVDLPADSKGTSRSRQIQTALKDLLTQLGIPLEGNPSVFYNEMTGMVMVRVAPDDLETIAAAIQTLGGSAKTEAAANKK